MSTLEIVLILLGAVVIIISCFLTEKSSISEINTADLDMIKHQLSLEETEQIKKKIDSILSEVSEVAVMKTEDALSKISNEKIIAVNDFSEQIIEKINKNHEEVVFLYNMLNEKESQLKDLLKHMDKPIGQAGVSQNQQVNLKLNDSITTDSNELTIKNDKSEQKNNIKHKSKSSNKSKAMSQKQKVNDFEVINEKDGSLANHNGIDINNNEKILELYHQNKSIIEISKILGVGQGEVKLVIDLFYKS